MFKNYDSKNDTTNIRYELNGEGIGTDILKALMMSLGPKILEEPAKAVSSYLGQKIKKLTGSGSGYNPNMINSQVYNKVPYFQSSYVQGSGLKLAGGSRKTKKQKGNGIYLAGQKSKKKK